MIGRSTGFNMGINSLEDAKYFNERFGLSGDGQLSKLTFDSEGRIATLLFELGDAESEKYLSIKVICKEVRLLKFEDDGNDCPVIDELFLIYSNEGIVFNFLPNMSFAHEQVPQSVQTDQSYGVIIAQQVSWKII